jgi:hypothetical protein
MPITTGRFGVDQYTKEVTQYVPPTVKTIGTVTLPDPTPEPAKPPNGGK